MKTNNVYLSFVQQHWRINMPVLVSVFAIDFSGTGLKTEFNELHGRQQFCCS